MVDMNLLWIFYANFFRHDREEWRFIDNRRGKELFRQRSDFDEPIGPAKPRQPPLFSA